jgi:transcriptional regulator with XRE-family HTH domain
MAGINGGRDWLSRTLRELRTGAGLRQIPVAKAAGITQPRLSRIERGEFLPKPDEVRKLLALYKAPAPLRREILQAVDDLRPGTIPSKTVISRGSWKMQHRIRLVEEKAAEICGFQNAVVIGLLQTPAYMRLVFAEGGKLAPDDLERSMRERAARASVLGSDRDIRLIMTEGVLRWQAGSPEVMVEQLEDIAHVSVAYPQVRVGIIPQSRGVEVFPLHGFSMYDRRSVQVGMRTGTSFIEHPGDVADYSQLFDDLERLAVFGEDARTVILRVAAEYRAF